MIDSDYVIPIKISVGGNVDSSKSTTIGVLMTNELDDGNGKARSVIFNHQHEKESGRTSSITQKTVVVNENEIIFHDLAGHEKYLNTTLLGLSGIRPDYCMIMVGGHRGIQKMTKEHLIASVYLNIPIFIVISKIDSVPKEMIDRHEKTIRKMLKSLK